MEEDRIWFDLKRREYWLMHLVLQLLILFVPAVL